MKEFAMSGTLGDAFIVYCKLREYVDRTGEEVRLYRYSQHPDFDDPIEQLFSYSPNITYHRPCLVPDDVDEAMHDPVAPYVNAFWDGEGRWGYPDDPDDIHIDPFPDMNIEPRELSAGFNVGIQLHTGKPESNFKGFSTRWLRKLRAELPVDKFTFHLYGIGDGYAPHEYRQLGDLDGVHDYIGETEFKDWLQHIVSLDYYITPEGFSGFFSMSQEIPTLLFFTKTKILLRVPPEWRQSNTLLSVGKNSIRQSLSNAVNTAVPSRESRFDPLSPTQVRSLLAVESKLL